MNGLLGYANQKYREGDEIRQAYPAIREAFMQGEFPDEIVDGLTGILEESGTSPLIVRSSSLLEDSFGTSFAGKYESHFLPNQGSDDENLKALLKAIASVYGSVYSPEALFYRQRMGLIDYDERMAILIQVVQGQHMGRYFLPDAAGVAFSRNQFRWSPRIDRTSGFLRLVWGLGTRAVEPAGGDYPRLVALSHPELRPESEAEEIRRYSQHFVDLIDLDGNQYETLPVPKVVNAGVPSLSLIAQSLPRRRAACPRQPTAGSRPGEDCDHIPRAAPPHGVSSIDAADAVDPRNCLPESGGYRIRPSGSRRGGRRRPKS